MSTTGTAAPGTGRDDRDLRPANVIPLATAAQPAPSAPAAAPLAFTAMLVAAALAVSPLWSGYYNSDLWEPLALGAIVLLVIVAFGARPSFTPAGLTAGGALLLLLSLSAASMLWAESREAAWTATDQIGLYAVIFAVGVLAIRGRRASRSVVIVLGLPALLTTAAVLVALLIGEGQGAFLTARLNSPMGYINGTAGLLVMGIWPWIALAETARRPGVRAGALAAAAAIASTAVLTQSRAIVPALLLTTVLVLLAAPNRTRRAVHLVVIAVVVALGLHWTLAVYSSSGPTQTLPLTDGVLRSAGVAILASGLLAGAAKLALSAAARRATERQRIRATRALGRGLMAGTAVGILIIAIVGGPAISRQYDTFTQLKQDQSAPDRFLSGGGFRYDLWRVALDEFRDHPLGGLGAGNYDADYYALRHNPQYVLQPHSLELQVLAELGIAGIVLLLVFCGAVLGAGFARTRTLASEDPLIRLSALGIFSAWLTATSVDWLYNIPGLAGAAMLAAALLVVPASTKAVVSAPPNRGRIGQAALVISIAALAMLAASVGRQYIASRYAAAGHGRLNDSPDKAIGALRTAARLDPYALTTLYTLASAYARLDDYRQARAALLLAGQREPSNYVTPALLGDLALRRGYPRVAVRDYAHAQSLNPRDPHLAQSLAAAMAQVR